MARLSADTVQAVGEEEGKPAHNEDSHDHGKDKGEAFLPGSRHFLSIDGATALTPRREQVDGLGTCTRFPAGIFGGGAALPTRLPTGLSVLVMFGGPGTFFRFFI